MFSETPKTQIVYLTPDSHRVLREEEFRSDGKQNIYVLGGIADRVIRKNLTLDRAKDLGIAHCKLPLHLLPDITGRRCLNVDAVFRILLRLQDTGESMIRILDSEVPKRNRKSTPSKNERRRCAETEEKVKSLCHWPVAALIVAEHIVGSSLRDQSDGEKYLYLRMEGTGIAADPPGSHWNMEWRDWRHGVGFWNCNGQISGGDGT